MSKFFLLILLILSASSVTAQECKVTVKFQNQAITALFKQIEAQCGYTFIYSDEVIADTMLVTVDVERVPVSTVLKNILPAKQLFYQMQSENMIVVGSESLKKQEIGMVKALLTGEIITTEGNAVPFATITLLEETMQVGGAIANEKGEFQLSYPLKVGRTYLLKASSMGFETTEISFLASESHRSAKAFGKIKQKMICKN